MSDHPLSPYAESDASDVTYVPASDTDKNSESEEDSFFNSCEAATSKHNYDTKENSESDTSVIFPSCSQSSNMNKVYSQKSSQGNETKMTTKLHACVFCNDLFTKLPLHYERRHKDEIQVQIFLSLPKRSKERKAAIAELVNKGDFDHNMSVKREGKGMIIPKSRRNEDADNLVPCTHCFAMYNIRNSASQRIVIER